MCRGGLWMPAIGRNHDRKAWVCNRRYIAFDDVIYDELVSDFDLIEFEKSAVDNAVDSNNYVQGWVQLSDLYVLQEARVRKAYSDAKEVGLFHLFFTKQYFNIICQWTNARLKENYNITISEAKFRTYVGLEMAMSIVSFNDIAEYWQREMFCGHEDFKNTMSRDDFMRIRSKFNFKLVFRPPEPAGHDVIGNDPLWFSRKMLTIFQKNCAQIAVPVGTAALLWMKILLEQKPELVRRVIFQINQIHMALDFMLL